MGLSDVERLGECSMPTKTDCEPDFQFKNISRLNSAMVYLREFFRDNTSLTVTKIKGLNLIQRNSYTNINSKSQLELISTLVGSLQLVGQNLRPKVGDHAFSRNWGFPKGSNAYLHLKVEENDLVRERRSHIMQINKLSLKTYGIAKGWQSIYRFPSLSGRIYENNYVISRDWIRRYSTDKGKTKSLEVKREIECSYKQLFDVEIYKSAYQALKSIPGNMTPGIDDETLDGISLIWAKEVIERMKDRTFQFKPSSRVYIPKANGKMRPLGIPSPRDKIIQQAIKMIYESVFEPVFLDTSHGFRPNRSTITAIFEVRKWNGITWIIEGDIKGYFDNINHQKLGDLIKKRIKDQNLVDLYWKLVSAGYVNDGKYQRSELGVPQGGVLSPLLSNIYLHEFDLFMKDLCEKYTTTGEKVSKANLKSAKLYGKIRKLTEKAKSKKLNISEKEELKKLREKYRRTPTVIRNDETGTRVYYNRYADDWVIGVSGSMKLVKQIKEEVSKFLSGELELTLSEDKTKITHMETEKVSYLGYLISKRNRRYTESQISSVKDERSGKIIQRRPSTATIIIEAPIKKIIKKLTDQKFAKCDNGKKPRPTAVTKWIFLPLEDIINRYNAIIRGILWYYKSVENRNQMSYMLWILKFSACFTISRKLNISPRKVYKKFGNPITIRFKKKGEEKLISLYEPKSLKRDRTFNLQGYFNYDPFKVKFYSVRSKHIWDQDCAICSSSDNVEMHHVKHIKKGKVKGFTQIMKQLNRKQIPVCKKCHMNIHSGRYDGIALKKLNLP